MIGVVLWLARGRDVFTLIPCPGPAVPALPDYNLETQQTLSGMITRIMLVLVLELADMFTADLGNLPHVPPSFNIGVGVHLGPILVSPATSAGLAS